MPKRLVPGPGRIAIRLFGTDTKHDIGGGKILHLVNNPRQEGKAGEVAFVHGAPYWEDGRKIEHGDYKVGDVVIIGKHSGTEVSIGRDTYIIVTETSVICQLIDEEEASGQPAEPPA